MSLIMSVDMISRLEQKKLNFFYCFAIILKRCHLPQKSTVQNLCLIKKSFRCFHGTKVSIYPIISSFNYNLKLITYVLFILHLSISIFQQRCCEKNLIFSEHGTQGNKLFRKTVYWNTFL